MHLQSEIYFRVLIVRLDFSASYSEYGIAAFSNDRVEYHSHAWKDVQNEEKNISFKIQCDQMVKLLKIQKKKNSERPIE